MASMASQYGNRESWRGCAGGRFCGGLDITVVENVHKHANLQGFVTREKLNQDKMERTLSLLKGTLDYEELKDVDMVIEAVNENMSLKQSIFEDIEKNCTSECIFASNTSTISLDVIGKRTSSQDRILGIHLFRLQDLSGYGIFLAGVKEDQIVNIKKIGGLSEEAQGPRPETGRTGGCGARKKNGKGYYTYNKGSKPEADHSVIQIVEESMRLTNNAPDGKPISVTDEETLEMIFFPVVNEASRVIEEGIVVPASDIDIASVHGFKFPSET
ncbi:hypothetical protein RND71_042509 [Anisodus tanguticus]|uniref:3-hydroxyacyl-CoA dehydrogenase NAD binding domain-containing protein n=1 Tax=Anisodus tanguticus TaxID=243964 RepID=A0AAE1QTJ6_9SOLA|nr:hypothetical protein RND71_042509 [Anisodus tanguticus]